MRYKFLILAVGAAALAWSMDADAKVGRRCGGPLGITCGHGEWCQPPTGHCRPGAPGRCARVPEICSFIFLPVCGCNGMTYPNDCLRQNAKEPKKHNGKC